MPFLAPTSAPWFSNNTPLQVTPTLVLYSLWHPFVSDVFLYSPSDLRTCCDVKKNEEPHSGLVPQSSPRQEHPILQRRHECYYPRSKGNFPDMMERMCM